MRIKCAKPPLCYDFSGVGKFLDRPEVRTALHIRTGTGTWQSCNFKVRHIPCKIPSTRAPAPIHAHRLAPPHPQVNKMFMGDWMKNYQTQIPALLGAGIRVLIYAGDQDFICNVRPRRVTRVECTPCARPERYARC